MAVFFRKALILVSITTFLVFALGACKGDNPIGKWKDGRVPYYLSGSFTSEEATIIRSAMDEWESVAAVKFIEVTPRSGAYKIIKVNENTWSSSIGENNADCEMNFGTGGDTYSHVLHELGHALGLLHEHQRPDRDRFVRIVWSNLIEQFRINFLVRDNPLIVEEEYDYDYQSIMHYPANSFSLDGSSATIEPVDPTKTINRLGIITPLDAMKIREIYGAPEDE